MCGRSSLTKTEKEIEKRFNAIFYTEELAKYNTLPNYNVAPTQFHPVVQMHDTQYIHFYRWGLIPSWAKDTSVGAKMINARAESLREKATFKRLLDTQRCIIPLDGFYEWKKNGKVKTPFRIVTTNQDIFSVAGLYDLWTNPTTNEVWHTFTIITIPANSVMKEIHDRMPVIFTSETEKYWLAKDLPFHDLWTLLAPYPSENMKIFEITDKVNSVKNNDPSLLLPRETVSKPIQISLF